MQIKNLILFLLLLVGNCIKLPAQYISPDSLKKVINTAKEDTVRIDAMNWLAFRHYQTDPNTDTCKFWANKALSLSTKVNYKAGSGFAYINLGNIYFLEGDILQAGNYYKKTIKMLEETGEKRFRGIACSNLGLLYNQTENYSEGLRYLYMAMRLQTEAGYDFGIAHCNFVWGNHHLSLGNYKEAHENLQTSAILYLKLKEMHLFSLASFSKGNANLGLSNYQLALKDFNDAINAYRPLGDPGWIKAQYHWSIAGVLEKQGDSCASKNNIESTKRFYNDAEKEYLTAIQYTLDQYLNELSRGSLYSSLGKLYQKQKKYSLARRCFNESISIAASEKATLSDTYYSLSVLDSVAGNFKAAYTNYKKYVLYRDSLFTEANARKTEQYKVEFEFEKKEDEIKLLTAENNLKTTVAVQHKQQKNIAIAGIALILIAGGYGFLRFRRRKSLQHKQALTNERLRISNELHDEVGATLSGIAMYSHLTKEQIKNNNPREVEKSLSIMQQSAGEMVNKLNDIVWLINPSQDTLQKLIQRLQEYAADMAAIKNMQVKFGDTDNFAVQHLPVESRRNIYLFCKEAINNAVKYSGASLLELTVKESNNLLEIVICDDGKGFDFDTIKRGNGLNNMQKRADELGADLTVRSKPGEGCRVLLKLKITQ